MQRVTAKPGAAPEVEVSVVVAGRPLLYCDSLARALSHEPGLRATALLDDGALPAADLVLVCGRSADEEAHLLEHHRTHSPATVVSLGFSVDGRRPSFPQLLARLREHLHTSDEVAALRPERSRRYAVLTPREVEVLRRIAAGLTGQQIAEELDMRPRTVSHHKRRIFEKLDVQTQSHAVATALREGIVLQPRS